MKGVVGSKCGTSVPLDVDDQRGNLRHRKREKQLRYQRHKARLSNSQDGPSSTSATTSPRDPSPSRIMVPESTQFFVLSSPSSKNALATPFIQTVLSTPSRMPTTKNDIEEKYSENPEREEYPGKHVSLKHRHQVGTTTPQSRKTGLVQQMRETQKSITAISPNHSITSGELDSREVEDSFVSDQSTQGQEPTSHLLDDEDKYSESGTVTTVESKFHIEDEYATPDEAPCLQNFERHPSTASPIISPFQSTTEKHRGQMDDATLEFGATGRVETFVERKSSPIKTFDMRSILEHPLSSPEARNNTDNDRDLAFVESHTDVALFNPMDDEFVHRLMRIEESQQEGKKEKEVSDENRQTQAVDSTWDTSISVFEESLAVTPREFISDKSFANTVDMLDTSSCEESPASFADVETHFIHFMEGSMSDEITSNLSFEQKQVLEDVKRNVQLAGNIERVGSDAENGRCHSLLLSKGNRLETPKEDEPLLFHAEDGEAYRNYIKEQYPSMDESSLVGIMSKSEEDAFSSHSPASTNAPPLPPTYHHESVAKQGSHRNEFLSNNEPEKTQVVEVSKEDEPLLPGIPSSDEWGGTEIEYRIPVEERLEMYNAPKEKDDESSAPDDEECLYDEDEEEDVEYKEQGSDDEDATVDVLNSLSAKVVERLSQDVPTFDDAHVAAINPNESVTIQVRRIPAVHDGSEKEFGIDLGYEMNDDKIATSSVSTLAEQCINNLAMMPPPPPPPPGEKRKKRNKVNKRGKIGLIAPCPEEKLKKWEAEKMRGHARLVTTKPQLDALSMDVPSATTGVLFARLFPSSSTRKGKSPGEKAQSSNIIDNLAGRKTAEKFIIASSAAALSFEGRLLSDQLPLSSAEESSIERPVSRGAFQSWEAFGNSFPEGMEQGDQLSATRFEPLKKKERNVADQVLLAWLSREVLGNTNIQLDDQGNVPLVMRLLLENDQNFNMMCQYMADSVNNVTVNLGEAASFDGLTLMTTFTEDESIATVDNTTSSADSKQSIEKKRPLLQPMVLSQHSQPLSSDLLAANFVSFIYLASRLANIPSPFGHSNPFLADIVNKSLHGGSNSSSLKRGTQASQSPQQVIFDNPMGRVEDIVEFMYCVCKKSKQDVDPSSSNLASSASLNIDAGNEEREGTPSEPSTPCTRNTTTTKGLRFKVPNGHPSPFETALWAAPRIVPALLSFLGDPVAVCRMKMVNRYCRRLVSENEHMLMQDAVRIGGLSMNIRPAFWMWICLQKCRQEQSSQARRITTPQAFRQLEKSGVEGKWHHVIKRDVERSFGNMPPHKTGARLRNDSIVRALVTWGKNRIMRRGVKGGGEETPLPELGPSRKHKDKPVRHSASPPPWECSPDDTGDCDLSETPTNTVSDWGGVSPVASMAESSNAGFTDDADGKHDFLPREELALSGNCLTAGMKIDLQNKLSFILNALAAAHDDVGYCQGMDYVVAHLLRILQDTIRWNALQNNLPDCIVSVSTLPDLSTLKDEPLSRIYEEVDKSVIVEEAVFRVMDAFFTSYNLRHMYWPELRCLKTCCRVFERLIQMKLPVLADHFEHHDLNVGLFALGWFQTLFLYLPSMPSATVCHMWDIWLVERSFKIFFRVGTAILFLSQPILLNHELEGMMTYLNTIPDATLLKPDILIACALNIKVTNSMLQKLEAEVTSSGA